MANITLGYPALFTKYLLFLPLGQVWVYDDLTPGTFPAMKTCVPVYPGTGEIHIPIDLISAARLRLIRPNDGSGLSDEQWAWIRLIGLTGESA